MKTACTWLSLFSCACAASAGGGVDLVLVTNPALNTPERVLREVDMIHVIVHSPDGLYPPGSEEDGEVQIKEAHADPGLELFASVRVPDDHLPVIRLMRGTLPFVRLDVDLRGLPSAAGADEVAIGGVENVQLGDPIERIDVPFNLRPDFLPPLVTEVRPNENDGAEACSIGTIYLTFMSAIDESTIESAVQISPGTIESYRVTSLGEMVELTVSGLDGDGTDVEYMVSVAPTLLDRRGRPLDQDPNVEGAQGFEDSLVVPCTEGRAAAETLCADGGDEATCGTDRLACVSRECVPQSCENARCESGTICDPESGECVYDCRLWEGAPICAGDRFCADSGLCVAI